MLSVPWTLQFDAQVGCLGQRKHSGKKKNADVGFEISAAVHCQGQGVGYEQAFIASSILGRRTQCHLRDFLNYRQCLR